MNDYKDKRLKGKVAIVTGSARGIGKGIAERFTKEGAKVVIVSEQKRANEGKNTAENIKEMGGEATFIKADLTIEEDVKNMVKGTLEKYDKLDILVNNAGVAITKPIEECTLEDYDFVQDVDLKGLWLCCREAVSPMKDNGGGKIINISSTSGVVAPFPNQSIYCAAKGGVIQLTRALAIEFRNYNILVNCVAPSFIKTPLYEDLDWSLKDPENLKALTDITPLGRIGTVEECAGAAFFLASKDSSFVTGQTIFVDGGLVSW